MSGAGYGAAAQAGPYGYDSAFGGGYGDDMSMQKASWQQPRKKMNLVGVCACFLMPFFLFTLIFSTQSFSIKYDNPGLASTVTMLGLLFVALTGYLAFAAWKRKGSGSDPTWYGFLFLTSLLAWMLSLTAGAYNFSHNMAPYYDVSNLNVYPSVDPATMRGQQLMDAGRFVFTADSRLDISLSMGFRNLDTYCVAPVVSGNGSMGVYDFWAVGVNCCSGHVTDFHCGEFNNPRAQAGLRLMRDDMRSFFRLAVQQAEASFNIKAAHPIFLYWMQDPIAEINAYQDGGYKFFLTGVFSYFAFQLFCTVIAIFVFSKMTGY